MATRNVYYNVSAWTAGAVVTTGQIVSNAGKAYRAVAGGTSGDTAPTHTSGTVSDNSINWLYLSTIDYTTVQAAWDAIPSTLTEAEEIVIDSNGEIVSSSIFLNVTVAKTTSVSNTITIRPRIGRALAENVGRLTYDPTRGIAFRRTGNGNAFSFSVDQQNTTLFGLQIKSDTSGSSGCPISITGTTAFIVDRCLFWWGPNAGGNPAQTAKFRNCVFVYENTVTNASPGLNSAHDNCLLVRPSNLAVAGGILASPAATRALRNTMWFGFSTGASGSNWTGAKNATDLASGPGGVTGNILSVPYTTATFVQPSNADPATHDLRLAVGATALIGAATVDTTNVPSGLDFFGVTRGASWDVGPTEYVALGGGGGGGRKPARSNGFAI